MHDDLLWMWSFLLYLLDGLSGSVGSGGECLVLFGLDFWRSMRLKLNSVRELAWDGMYLVIVLGYENAYWRWWEGGCGVTWFAQGGTTTLI